jgi:hypothetical protein
MGGFGQEVRDACCVDLAAPQRGEEVALQDGAWPLTVSESARYPHAMTQMVSCKFRGVY